MRPIVSGGISQRASGLAAGESVAQPAGGRVEAKSLPTFEGRIGSGRVGRIYRPDGHACRPRMPVPDVLLGITDMSCHEVNGCKVQSPRELPGLF
jgi:hypothetical protein